MEFINKAMPSMPMTSDEMQAQERVVLDAAKATDYFTQDELERFSANARAEQDKVTELLWDSLKRAPEYKDRRQTGWGTKTQAGLAACVYRLGRESAAYQGMLSALRGVISHNDALKPEYQISPSLIEHVKRAIAAAKD